MDLCTLGFGGPLRQWLQSEAAGGARNTLQLSWYGVCYCPVHTNACEASVKGQRSPGSSLSRQQDIRAAVKEKKLKYPFLAFFMFLESRKSRPGCGDIFEKSISTM